MKAPEPKLDPKTARLIEIALWPERFARGNKATPAEKMAAAEIIHGHSTFGAATS